MNRLNLALLGILSVSNISLAAPCDTIVGTLTGWLSDSNHLVRVVTTHTGDDNVVTYSRGYLDMAEEAGKFESNSARYTNDSQDQVNAPFQRGANDVHLSFLTKPDNSAIEVSYTVKDSPEQSTAFLTSCRDNILFALGSKGIFTVSFRFSGTN